MKRVLSYFDQLAFFPKTIICLGSRIMIFRILKSPATMLLCIGLLRMAALAQLPVQEQNLSDCKDGSGTCDRSLLSASERAQLAVAEHQRNVVDCRNGSESCRSEER